MSYFISPDKMDGILARLKTDCRVYAPKRFPKQGWGERNEVVRYAEIGSFNEIVYEQKSDFSPKEVFYPMVQTLLQFSGDECFESEYTEQKDVIIFARACDINGAARLDRIFLENGGRADNYYERRRKKVKFFLMECGEGWDTCFCASMGTNATDDYAAAFRFSPDGLLVEVKDAELEKYFSGQPEADFKPEFVKKNKKTVNVPDIDDRSLLPEIVKLELWRGFDEKCIGCGGCNAVCPTCSCFDTADIIFDETSRDGERRRVWSSCMLKDFTTVAGGGSVRPKAGDRMRFKALHKLYDYRLRFGGGNMCVGCGRCDARCPEEIHFSETINALADEVEKLKAQREGDAKNG